jgi:hypothetical protein
LSAGIEQPAVEEAAQPAGLQPAIGEISTAMRTMALDQPVLPLRGAEQHEILA